MKEKGENMICILRNYKFFLCKSHSMTINKLIMENNQKIKGTLDYIAVILTITLLVQLAVIGGIIYATGLYQNF